jgi:hypothetical protein
MSRMRRGHSIGVIVAGLPGAAVVRVIRALPLVSEEPPSPADGTKKERKKNSGKMDKKKKGTGPRTRRKKAKKGK